MPITSSASTLSRQITNTICPNCPLMPVPGSCLASTRVLLRDDHALAGRVVLVELVHELVLARIDAANGEGHALARRQHLLLAELLAFELGRNRAGVGDLKLEFLVGRHLGLLRR